MLTNLFKHEEFIVETYSSGQFRFTDKYIMEDRVKTYSMIINSRNWDAKMIDENGSGITAKLDELINMQVEKIGSGVRADVHFIKGYRLLEANGIKFPMRQIGYSELYNLYKDLQSRPTIDINSVKSGTLVAYTKKIFHFYEYIKPYEVQMFKIGNIKLREDNGIQIETKPTEISKTYLKFALDPNGEYLKLSEEKKYYDNQILDITMERKNPLGTTKIVAITEQDMKLLKDLIPEDLSVLVGENISAPESVNTPLRKISKN